MNIIDNIPTAVCVGVVLNVMSAFAYWFTPIKDMALLNIICAAAGIAFLFSYVVLHTAALKIAEESAAAMAKKK